MTQRKYVGLCATQVPSSKVRDRLPPRPWTNCRKVAAFVSRVDSIPSFLCPAGGGVLYLACCGRSSHRTHVCSDVPAIPARRKIHAIKYLGLRRGMIYLVCRTLDASPGLVGCPLYCGIVRSVPQVGKTIQ